MKGLWQTPIGKCINEDQILRWTLCALCLLTFALRIAFTQERNYWLDEGFTLLRLPLSWAQIFSNYVPLQGLDTTDINPPIYFALLKLWTLVASHQEFALRLFSVMGMSLATPSTYLLGRTLFGRRVGTMAAGLATLSPAYQWYGWELRMYCLMPTLAALNMAALRTAISHKGFKFLPLIVWLALMLLAMLTHYTFVAFAITHGAYIFISLLRIRSSKQWPRIALAALGFATTIVLLAILPGTATVAKQMLHVLQSAVNNRPEEVASLWSLIQETLNGAFFGLNAADPIGGAWQTMLGITIAAGLIFTGDRATRHPRVILAISIVSPLLFWIALSYVIPNRPSFRYIIIALPALHCTLAWLIQHFVEEPKNKAAHRAAHIALAGGLALASFGASTFGLARSYVQTDTWMDYWRDLAEHIRHEWQPGDALLINIYVPEPVLRYYLDETPVNIIYANEFLKQLPEAGTQQLRTDYPRVWFLNSHKYREDEALERLRNFPQLQHTQFRSRTDILELALYQIAPRETSQLPTTARPLQPTVADHPIMRGFEIMPGSTYAKTPMMTLSIYWQLGKFHEPDASISVRLYDAQQTWMDWLRSADTDKMAAACQPNTLCKIDYALALPTDLPPKPYSIELQARTGAKNEIYQRDSAALTSQDAQCCLRKTGTYSWPVAQLADAQVARLELPNHPLVGEALPVVITWNLAKTPTQSWDSKLELKPIFGAPVASVTRSAGPVNLDVAQWPVGEPFRDPYALKVLPHTAPGLYELTLARNHNGTEMDSAHLAWVRLHEPEPSPIATQIQHPINAHAGDLTLLGWSVNSEIKRGHTLEFTTHWKVDAKPDRDGKIFLHAVRVAGTKPDSQDDHTPPRTTLGYRAGEGINQIHRLTLNPDLPAGEYTLYAGIYDSADFVRWPALLDGQPAKDDLIRIGSFTLPPVP